MLFNMNNYIRVRLTDEGRAIHKRNYDALLKTMPPSAAERFPYVPPKEDAEGWSEWQGWCLMKEFGAWMRMGAHHPFELTVEITETKNS